MDGILVLLIIFIAVYAWCMAVETSLLELNLNKIKFAAEDGDTRASALYKFSEKIDHYISSMQFVIIFSCIGAGLSLIHIFW